jgi:hypothetical protein
VNDNKLSRVDLMKLDIEGSELKALNGAKSTIKKFRPVIILGVNDNSLKASGTDRDAIQYLLFGMKYKIYKISETPEFAFEAVDDLTKDRIKVIFCFPENVTPPKMVQPEEQSLFTRIKDFFCR